jgi:hypothetical protein
VLNPRAPPAARINHVTTTYPCPHCRATASAETGCPSCGRSPDPDAIEVMRTDAEIAEMLPQLATARWAVSDLEKRIGHAYERRNLAAERVRAGQRPNGPKSAPETSSRAIQTTLFLLGGLLLAVAAMVFTAVAWSQFGVTGRATILAVVTAAALAIPPVAVKRGLRAAAETVAAVGVLLVLLDGYAAWYVNLLGVSGTDASRYAGTVFALTAALAAAYAHVTGLTGPRHAALLVAQPALPLLVLPAGVAFAGWTLTFGAMAALTMAVRRTRVAPLAYVLAALSTVAAVVPALTAAVRTMDTARPFFHTAWSAAVPTTSWRLPAALAAVAAALFTTVPARLRPATAFAGAATVALALPSGFHLPWWNAPVIDLVVIAAILFTARRAAPALAAPAARLAAHPAAASPSAPSSIATFLTKQSATISTITGTSGITGTGLTSTGTGLGSFAGQLITAALLTAHAVTTSFGRPVMATAVLLVIALLGAATASRARHTALSATGLFTALAAVPAIAWTATAATGLGSTAQLRAAAIATAALVAALRLLPAAARRSTAPGAWPPAALGAALLAAVPLPLWAAAAGEPAGVYAVLALLLTASALAATAGRAATGREAELATAASAAVTLGLALASGLLPARTVLLVALAALLVASAVTATAARAAGIRGLGTIVSVLAGWGVALVVPPGAVLEAYTLPASGLALAAALLARRGPSPSWVSFGPALSTALTPSTVLILTEDGQHLRRLLLGIGALAILLVGARARLRAPVLAGGAALAVLAVHELALVWDLVPRWIPLAAGGVLLVVIATTLERRRRDLARFRTALARMG